MLLTTETTLSFVEIHHQVYCGEWKASTFRVRITSAHLVERVDQYLCLTSTTFSALTPKTHASNLQPDGLGLRTSIFSMTRPVRTSSWQLQQAATRATLIRFLQLTGVHTAFSRLDNRQDKYTARFDLNHKINARHTLRGGIQGDLIAFDLADSVLYSEDEFFYERDFNDQSVLLQANATWQFRINEAWRLNAGIHGQHFRLSESTAIEPRVGIRFQATEKATFNAGAGLHSQMQPIPVYFTEERIDANTAVLTNDRLDFNKSLHTVIGYDIRSRLGFIEMEVSENGSRTIKT